MKAKKAEKETVVHKSGRYKQEQSPCLQQLLYICEHYTPGHVNWDKLICDMLLAGSVASHPSQKGEGQHKLKKLLKEWVKSNTKHIISIANHEEMSAEEVKKILTS